MNLAAVWMGVVAIGCVAVAALFIAISVQLFMERAAIYALVLFPVLAASFLAAAVEILILEMRKP